MLTLDLQHCLGATDRGLHVDRLLETLRTLPAGTLPLHRACTQGGIVDDSDLSISLLGCTTGAGHHRVRIGVFFSEVVGGCNCHDDPVASTAHAVLRVDIALADGSASVGAASEADG